MGLCFLHVTALEISALPHLPHSHSFLATPPSLPSLHSSPGLPLCPAGHGRGRAFHPGQVTRTHHVQASVWVARPLISSLSYHSLNALQEGSQNSCCATCATFLSILHNLSIIHRQPDLSLKESFGKLLGTAGISVQVGRQNSSVEREPGREKRFRGDAAGSYQSSD
jgi:hypothetical protein